jgi:hypothetical protein
LLIFYNFVALLIKLLTYLFFIFVFVSQALAQSITNTSSIWFIKPVVNNGFILVHRSNISHLVKGNPTIYELNIGKSSSGNKLWQIENNLPDIGISLQCIDFKNPLQLGYALTASPYIEIPLNKTPKILRPSIRLCWGLTYITKSYDSIENKENIAIGSHFNSFVQFRCFWRFKLSNLLRIEPGITFTHASNGKAKNPNLGLNVASLNLGLNYSIQSKANQSIPKIDSSTKAKSKNEVIFFTAIGFNQKQIASPILKTFVYSFAYQRNLRNSHKYVLGIDVFYDQNYLIDYENVFKNKAQGIDQLRMSVKLGYSYNVGRLSFPFELGYYFFQKTNPDELIVNRLGVRYYSKTGLIAHFGLRTHFAVAYNFEYGLGYRFSLK